MKLTVLLPTEIFLDAPAAKVVAVGPAGSFCLLPRHIDFVTALVPGLLSFSSPEGAEHFLAVEGGLLVKLGDQVRVVTRHAVRGALGELKAAVERMLVVVDERERATHAAVARLEAGFIRKFLDFGRLH
ncbi:MAG: F0F1 ATP synthase subunit epsilon [Desulfobacteraceae bacterium]|jgi:F-type H+-transporting ATPase subunit epsilon|nr:F0F1 ATP synthase subunit epsilon [Desulfobacteraceae bacterium]